MNRTMNLKEFGDLWALLSYVKKENIKTKAWVAENPAQRSAGLYPEDPRHWEERGITSLEQLERRELETYVYDAFKDVYGFRNHSYDFDSMSLQDLKDEADRLAKSIREDRD